MSCGREALQLRDRTAAIEIFRDLNQRYPESARAAYMLGTCLLDNGDPRGLDYLKTAMARDESATGTACARAIIFLHATGNHNAVTGFHNKLTAWQEETDCQISGETALTLDDRIAGAATNLPRDIATKMSQLKMMCTAAFVVTQTLPEWHEVMQTWLVVEPKDQTSKRLVQNWQAMHAGSLGDLQVHVSGDADRALLEALRTMDDATFWDDAPVVEASAKSRLATR